MSKLLDRFPLDVEEQLPLVYVFMLLVELGSQQKLSKVSRSLTSQYITSINLVRKSIKKMTEIRLQTSLLLPSFIRLFFRFLNPLVLLNRPMLISNGLCCIDKSFLRCFRVIAWSFNFDPLLSL